MQNAQNISVDDLLLALQTSLDGISEKEVEKRQKQYGKNVLEEKKQSKILLFLRQFHNLFIYILLVASLISFLSGKWLDVGIILTLVLINGILSYWQELKAENSIQALKKLVEDTEQVVRDGKTLTIPSSELVPGDIVFFKEGERVTADIRLIKTKLLKVDESSLTGESVPIEKEVCVLSENVPLYEQKNMLFAGTYLVRGRGQGVVVRTGKNTAFAAIAQLESDGVETPLTQAMTVFTKKYTVLLVGILSTIGVYGYIQGRKPLDVAYMLIAELVSAVPEGLPILITIMLVFGAVALRKQKTLVRYLPAVETLGSATVIASDKTGTITEGKLQVKKIFSFDDEILERVVFFTTEEEKESFDPIDIALGAWIQHKTFQTTSKRELEFPFDVQNRMMGAVYEVSGKKTLFVKGAFENLQKIAVNSEEEVIEFSKAVEAMAEEGLRVLAFGEGEFFDKKPWKIQMVGLVGFYDPPKEGVKEAVIQAKKAGIKVLMITGDHPLTAKTIAKEVGIYREGEEVLTGTIISAMQDEELCQKIQKTSVLARILPEHKYRIVKILQERKEIVAVTGDGVNDVPALKAANLGIAMGSGTEAARSVAKMVLQDNNFKVLVDAIKNGRVFSDNLRKALYFLISAGVEEITLISLSIFSNLPLPLLPLQILWINLISTGSQDKTFAFAKAENNVMTRKPKDPHKQFFDGLQIFRIFYFGIFSGALLFFLFSYLLDKFSYHHAVSLIFTSVVFTQLCNGILAQKESEPFLKNIKASFTINPMIFLGTAIGLSLQFLVLYLGRDWFQIKQIRQEQWVYPIFATLCVFLLLEARKWGEWVFHQIKNKRSVKIENGKEKL